MLTSHFSCPENLGVDALPLQLIKSKAHKLILFETFFSTFPPAAHISDTLAIWKVAALSIRNPWQTHAMARISVSCNAAVGLYLTNPQVLLEGLFVIGTCFPFILTDCIQKGVLYSGGMQLHLLMDCVIFFNRFYWNLVECIGGIIITYISKL